MNRLSRSPEQNNPQMVGEYFIVASRACAWNVSLAMARHIEACLDAWWRHTWVRFVDLSASRVRVRASHITSVTQCTREQRAFERHFAYLVWAERNADQACDDDE